ncbi:acyl-CoA dehydrogenase family protein [Microbulbifer hainanensis]|uniref:acyl-CoA dehydrogenase family protein n=1 Tax=Microbulbifer hainanensis TaxID=2735675 RepID=UPI001865BD3B|nr:acyl-CoA dehydrogenase [Microbulbifer hainanensis]
MNFSYSEEQQMLQDSVSKFIQQDYDFDTRRKITESPRGFSEENWNLFAELGWLMVPFSEGDGGLGGSATDLIVVMEEFGKGMLVEPFLATAVLGGGLIAECGNDSQKEELLAFIMGGELQLAFAFTEPESRYELNNVTVTAERRGDEFIVNGAKSVVLNGEAADKLLVAVRTSGEQRDRDGISLLLIDAEARGVRRRGYATVDGQRAAEISLDNVSVPAACLLGEEGKALPGIEKVIDRATLAICAEAVGAMAVTLAKTVEYTKTRKQFGVPISKFQALQHRMADMFIEVEQGRSILYMAAMQMDANGGVAQRAVSAAKSRIGAAARKVGQEAVQIHGGIGVTDELDVGHFFKRLTTFQFQFGSTDMHKLRFLNGESSAA